MTWMLVCAGMAGMAQVGLLYPLKAPGDAFVADPVQRRLSTLLLAVCVALIGWGLVAHAHKDVAVVACLFSMALGGGLLCFLRPLGSKLVLGWGVASAAVAVGIGVLSC